MSYRCSRFMPRRAVAVVAISSITALLALAGGLLAAGSAQASTLPTLTLTLTKTSITVGGATQSGAVNVVTTGHAASRKGRAILFLLKPGATVAEVETALKNGAGKDPNKASKYGTIVFDEEASPGKTNEAQTYLQPGSVRCPRRRRRRRAEAQRALHGDRLPHHPARCRRRRPRSARSSSASVDRARGTTASSCALKTKASSCTWTSCSPSRATRPPSRSSRICWPGRKRGSKSSSPGNRSAPGRFRMKPSSRTTITAKPGWYVQACFMETQDGRVHTRLGMERIIRIVK